MSTSAHNKRIVIIAGPNGAGKTTFARGYKKYPGIKSTGVELFLNAIKGVSIALVLIHGTKGVSIAIVFSISRVLPDA